LLLIEDDLETSKLLQRFLERSGMQVVIAGDDADGLKVFGNGRFDLVIIDGVVPKASGLELVPALRKLPRGKEVGIIMMTAAFKSPKGRKESMDGVDAFFTKPFVMHDLKAKIDELLIKVRNAAMAQARATKAAPPSATHGASRTPSPPPRAPVQQQSLVERLSMSAAKIEALRHQMHVEAAPRPRPPGAPPLPDAAIVRSPVEVSRVLLQCARHRLSGTVRFIEESSELVIAFLKGVIVGASDNLREQLLGEMLWKQGRLTTEQMRELNLRIEQKGERVAEALLALGFISGDEMLALLDEQARARVRRALLWTGKLKVIVDEADALKRAVDSLELLDVLLAFALEPAQQDAALRFVADHQGKPLVRGPAFDDVLMAMARTKPDSALPGVLLSGSPNVTEAATASSPSEVFAAHLAEFVRLPDDPPADVRPLPIVMRSDVGTALVDRVLTKRVSALLLKTRGRSAYALFDKPRTATAEEMSACADELLARLSEEMLVTRSLGPALPAAREVCAILEDYRDLFADPLRRSLYDSLWVEQPAHVAEAPGPEDAFLEGQLALSKNDVKRALVCFESAVAMRRDDAEYKSWLAWGRVLSGDVKGVDELLAVMGEHPQSMRPIFFLGLHAVRSGEVDMARGLLQECLRRSPHDVEIQAALSALKVSLPSARTTSSAPSSASKHETELFDLERQLNRLSSDQALRASDADRHVVERAATVEKMENEHRDTLARLREDHGNAIANLTAEHETALDRAVKNLEIAKANVTERSTDVVAVTLKSEEQAHIEQLGGNEKLIRAQLDAALARIEEMKKERDAAIEKDSAVATALDIRLLPNERKPKSEYFEGDVDKQKESAARAESELETSNQRLVQQKELAVSSQEVFERMQRFVDENATLKQANSELEANAARLQGRIDNAERIAAEAMRNVDNAQRHQEMAVARARAELGGALAQVRAELVDARSEHARVLALARADVAIAANLQDDANGRVGELMAPELTGDETRAQREASMNAGVALPETSVSVEEVIVPGDADGDGEVLILRDDGRTTINERPPDAPVAKTLKKVTTSVLASLAKPATPSSTLTRPTLTPGLRSRSERPARERKREAAAKKLPFHKLVAVLAIAGAFALGVSTISGPQQDKLLGGGRSATFGSVPVVVTRVVLAGRTVTRFSSLRDDKELIALFVPGGGGVPADSSGEIVLIELLGDEVVSIEPPKTVDGLAVFSTSVTWRGVPTRTGRARGYFGEKDAWVLIAVAPDDGDFAQSSAAEAYMSSLAASR
jgi:DNA-binding response OmpR family regulator